MKKSAIFLLTLPLLINSSSETLENRITKYNQPMKIVQEEPIQAPKATQKSYDELLSEIKIEQNNFKQKYLKANNEEKKKIISEASDYVFDALSKKIFPAWYDTPWAFYGVVQRPNVKPKGYNAPDDSSIACGYFVTTTMKHVGFNIERITLAMQPSETMIKNLSSKENITRYSNKSAKVMEQEIKKMKKGIYVVGLDNHTGFIVNDVDVAFVNSDYYPKKGRVVSESVTDYNAFLHSGYRVLGRIDDHMIKKWILGEKFPIKYKYKKKN